MEKTFSGTVKEKKREERGPVLLMDIPTMGSRWPASISDVPEDVWNKVSIGDVMNVVLVSQNLRKNKQGVTYSGDKDWHWWWGFVRNASVVESQKAQEAAKIAVATEDQKEVAIRRAVALKAAVNFLIGTDSIIGDVLDVAERFDAWLAVGIAQGTHQVPQGMAPAVAPVDSDNEAKRAIANATAFWDAVIKLYPGKPRDEVRELVLPMFGGNPAAWMKAEGKDWAAALEKVKEST